MIYFGIILVSAAQLSAICSALSLWEGKITRGVYAVMNVGSIATFVVGVYLLIKHVEVV